MRWLLTLLVLLCGCRAPLPTQTIKLDSEPQGARIFVGVGPNQTFADSSREFVGRTPCEWTTETSRDGRWRLKGAFLYGTFVAPVAVFTAEPPHGETNLFTKRQVFQSGTPWTPSDPVPSGIFFDLTKP